MAARLLNMKYVIQTAIETCVQARGFSRNNEAAVTLTVPEADSALLPLLNDHDFASEFFIVAGLEAATGAELSASAAKTAHPLCPRCRRHEPAAADSGLCARCAQVVS